MKKVFVMFNDCESVETSIKEISQNQIQNQLETQEFSTFGSITVKSSDVKYVKIFE